MTRTAQLAAVAALCGAGAPAADFTDAADALAAALASRSFVFVGSTHGDAKIEEFLNALLSRPAFQRQATDIVVEWAGSGRQRLLDRYLLELEAVPADELAGVWLDTDSPELWATLPQVRRFVETLREVNRSLPASKRIRLLGGNEGVDWTKVRAVEDLAPYPYKTNFMSHLLAEHLAKSPASRTLVVYGDGHIRHEGRNFMADVDLAIPRSQQLVVGTIRDLKAEEKEAVAKLGDPSKPFFAPKVPADLPWIASLRTSVEELARRPADTMDAVLYLGPEPDRDLKGAFALSAAQRSEIARRAAIHSDPQRAMKARLAGRDGWFRSHPGDLPPRPQAR